jgi:branched-chain amino acid transport system substrate-binding protein
MRAGGINGVKLLFEECETGYDTARSVECYERLKGKNGGATLIHPWSTGATFALTEKAPADKIPLMTTGYGRSESADGTMFKWNFPLLGTYWVAPTPSSRPSARRKGAWTSSRARRSPWSTTTARSARSPSRCCRSAARCMALAAAAAGDGARRGTEGHLAAGAPEPPDYTLLWGWGVMNSTALKEAQATGYPREKMYGVWWAGAEPDVKDVGEGAKGYNAVTLQHGTDRRPRSSRTSWPCCTTRARAPAQGGSGPGAVHARRGERHAGVEGIRAAQERFGKGKVMTGEQVRWGLENLNLTQKPSWMHWASRA